MSFKIPLQVPAFCFFLYLYLYSIQWRQLSVPARLPLYQPASLPVDLNMHVCKKAWLYIVYIYQMLFEKLPMSVSPCVIANMHHTLEISMRVNNIYIYLLSNDRETRQNQAIASALSLGYWTGTPMVIRACKVQFMLRHRHFLWQQRVWKRGASDPANDWTNERAHASNTPTK